jgi:hypothetical protein
MLKFQAWLSPDAWRADADRAPVPAKWQRDSEQQPGIFSMDPSSLAVNFTGKTITLTLNELSNARVAALGLAAGHFGNATYDQLVVVYTVVGGTALDVTSRRRDARSAHRWPRARAHCPITVR